MNVSNQERYALKMPQVIIEDKEYKCVSLDCDVNTLNEATLESMYRVQTEIYKLFGLCDMNETRSNIINPSQQNIFIPLKTWNINLGGCFANVSIHQGFLDGCFAEIEIL